MSCTGISTDYDEIMECLSGSEALIQLPFEGKLDTVEASRA